MASNATQFDHVLVTDDDQGPVLAIVTWFLMTVMALAVVARVTIKLAIRRELKIEDFSVMAALVGLKKMHFVVNSVADEGIHVAVWDCTVDCDFTSSTEWLGTTRKEPECGELGQYSAGAHLP